MATIEHVMPKTLSAEWRDALGPGYADIYAQWLDTLGNLTLTGYNSELGNLSFAEKQKKLRHTHFELTRGILEQLEWGTAEIEARGRRLAKSALQRWSRD